MKKLSTFALGFFLSLLLGCSGKEETSFLLKCDGILHSGSGNKLGGKDTVTKNDLSERTEYFQFNDKKLNGSVCSRWDEKEISCYQEIDDAHTKLVLLDRRTGEVIVTETNLNKKYTDTPGYGIFRFAGKCQKVDKKF